MYNLVRIIRGTIVDVGLGKRDVKEIVYKTSIILNYYSYLLHQEENISGYSTTQSLEAISDDFYTDSTKETVCYGDIKQKKR